MSLAEKDNYDCVFWEEGKGCVIYPVRPVQCRSYPFWAHVVEDEESWKREALHCPGIGKGSRKFSAEEVEEWLYSRRCNQLLEDV